MLSSLFHLLLVRLVVYSVNLCVFYFYRIIGKLTDFLQLHEFIAQNKKVWRKRAKEGQKGTKTNLKKINFFHHTRGMCGVLTAQHVRRM